MRRHAYQSTIRSHSCPLRSESTRKVCINIIKKKREKQDLCHMYYQAYTTFDRKNVLHFRNLAFCYLMYIYLSFKVGGVRLGEHNIQTDPDCEQGYCAEPVQDFLPESIIVHEDYNNPAYKNDIAIIRLNKPIVYNGKFIN